MKIGLFMPLLGEGGVQKVMINLYSGFKNKNLDSKIIVCDSLDTIDPKIDKSDLIDLKIKRCNGDYKTLFSIRKLINIIKKEKFDIVVAAPGFSTIILLVAKIIKRLKIKTVILVDNKISLLKKGKIKHKISYLIYKKMYKFADKVIVAHDIGAIDIKHNFKLNDEKVKRIYHPLIDENKIKNAKEVNHLWLNKDNFIIFSAGRLCKEKNYTQLIDAFYLFRKKVKNAKLLIAGTGQEEKNILEKISYYKLEDSVEMLGHIDNVIGYMKKSNMYVLSSNQEAFGIVLVEALACGIPIVSTDCSSGAQREILMNGELGLLCKINDSVDLYEKMYESYTNDCDLSEKEKNRAKEFTIKKSINEYIVVFEELLK